MLPRLCLVCESHLPFKLFRSMMTHLLELEGGVTKTWLLPGVNAMLLPIHLDKRPNVSFYLFLLPLSSLAFLFVLELTNQHFIFNDNGRKD